MTDSLEIQMGLEKALSLLLEDMRNNERELQKILKAWKPAYRVDVGAVERVNKAGYALFISVTSLERSLALFSPLIETRGYKTERDEIAEAWELLGSWDLYARFGWQEIQSD